MRIQPLDPPCGESLLKRRGESLREIPKLTGPCGLMPHRPHWRIRIGRPLLESGNRTGKAGSAGGHPFLSLFRKSLFGESKREIAFPFYSLHRLILILKIREGKLDGMVADVFRPRG